MKSHPRLPLGAKYREKVPIEDWLSVPITLALIRLAEPCDLFPMVRAPDPAPSDSFLFGYLKTMFQERHFETGDEHFAVIIDLTNTIEKVTLDKVFLEWMDRLAKYIRTNGDYVGGDE
jgi:hypothetical protein